MKFSLQQILLGLLSLCALSLGSPLFSDTSYQAATHASTLDEQPTDSNTTLPVPHLVERNFGGKVACDTSSGSPRLHEIDNVIRTLRGLTYCTKWNPWCQTIARSGPHAAVSLCGLPWAIAGNARCNEIADQVKAINQTLNMQTATFPDPETQSTHSSIDSADLPPVYTPSTASSRSDASTTVGSPEKMGYSQLNDGLTPTSAPLALKSSDWDPELAREQGEEIL
ncbi:hypothetical protein EDC01DRAFT_774694 [Geopyxis carbonaria]|nr:hypothetical protein EDC01DRAFT_774694 [Geopyxis carbonaria]